MNGDSQLFLQIGEGDLVLAYATGNMIAYVGEVSDGKCSFDAKNEIGREFDYPNQLRVTWWDEPNHFKRTDLPAFFSEQLGKRGKTVVRLDLGNYSLAKFTDVVRACANSGSAAPELNEDMIKAGLRKYLQNHQDFLEPGLHLSESEAQISRESRPDFVGSDAMRRRVLVECKGTATASAMDQILRYKDDYGGRPRLILVAFSFDGECRRLAKAKGVELVECTIVPKQV